MQEAASQLAEPLIKLLAVVLMVLVSLVTAAARKKLKDERALAVVELLDTAARDVVLEVEQTTTRSLKAANQDGKLTLDEAQDIRAQAYSRLKEVLGRRGLEATKQVLDKGEAELNALLEHKIEAKVSELRAGL